MNVITIILSLVVVLLVFFLIQLLLRLHALNIKVTQLESRIGSQQVSINGLTAGAVGVDNRLRKMQDRESAIEHRQESMENIQSQGESPFGEAIRLVQQGASEQRLMDDLGLSQSEASLIAMIHGGN